MGKVGNMKAPTGRKTGFDDGDHPMKARAAEGTGAQASFFSAHSESALSTGLGSFRSSMPMVGQHPPRWAWRGAHPGAGVTTLARELGGADVGMAATGAVTRAATGALPVLVVC